jgi:hypothetical protein
MPEGAGLFPPSGAGRQNNKKGRKPCGSCLVQFAFHPSKPSFSLNWL